MTERSRITSRLRLHRRLHALLSVGGTGWHLLANLGDFRSVGTVLRYWPRSARKCQGMPGTAQGMVRPTGFESVAYGSGGRWT